MPTVNSHFSDLGFVPLLALLSDPGPPAARFLFFSSFNCFRRGTLSEGDASARVCAELGGVLCVCCCRHEGAWRRFPSCRHWRHNWRACGIVVLQVRKGQGPTMYADSIFALYRLDDYAGQSQFTRNDNHVDPVNVTVRHVIVGFTLRRRRRSSSWLLANVIGVDCGDIVRFLDPRLVFFRPRRKGLSLLSYRGESTYPDRRSGWASGNAEAQ